MSDKIIKCNKCSVEKEAYSTFFKGANNTKLCEKCGRNICFICGKKETEKEWIEDYDCCGNKRMVEVEKGMFGQYEKEADNPNEEIFVHYCEQHQGEAQKSPLLFTEAERKSLREKKEKEQKDKLAQEKQEIEENLNSNKNLFYAEGGTAKDKNNYEYTVFRGKSKEHDYYLMVPHNHLIYKSTDPDQAKVIRELWHESYYLVLIEGVENIPIEKSQSDYWKWNSKKTINFHKIVGLNDKITIIEYKEKNEKEQPVKSKPQPTDSSLSQSPNDKTLLEYFQKNNIKSIKLEGKVLTVESEWKTGSSTISYSLQDLLTNSPELKGIDQYLENKSDKAVSRQELELSNSSDAIQNNKTALWIGCGIGGGAIIAVIIRLWLKRRKRVEKS